MDKIPKESAFPVDYDAVHDSGLSILDYFAAAALPAMITHTDLSLVPKDSVLSEVVAQNCYTMARSMMKERLKHQ